LSGRIGGIVTLFRGWSRWLQAALLAGAVLVPRAGWALTPSTEPSAQPTRGAEATVLSPAPITEPSGVFETLGRRISPWAIVPFVLILLAIAILPLIRGHWWESHPNKAVVSVLCALPVVAYLANLGPIGFQAIAEVLHDYYAFVVLLVALFTISGGIYLEGDLEATPIINTVYLGTGALLASFIGTTGAAVLLIRPLLKTNSERTRKTHVFVFFIFLVANIGGCLLPVGDPPLFLGYLYGVPFFWTLKTLWPAWLTAVAILLAVFYLWDTFAYSREPASALRRDQRRRSPLKVHGRTNFALILGVLLAVIYLRTFDLGNGVTLDVSWMRQPVMLLLALLSFALDYRRREPGAAGSQHHAGTPRDRNHFTFAPMIEVAVLFFGIFITMIPAICLLKAHGAESGITQPWQFFWMTGGLSSFLDNAPTYATYFALGQGVTQGLLTADPGLAVIQTHSGPIAAHILVAISLGAVFMGANTYIGNAPNFMVRSICEEAKVRMPSFFHFMLYSACILIPTFVLLMAIYVG
jgi:Na+/H+ antiporter NhaD/arsenite permease-like protein